MTGLVGRVGIANNALLVLLIWSVCSGSCHRPGHLGLPGLVGRGGLVCLAVLAGLVRRSCLVTLVVLVFLVSSVVLVVLIVSALSVLLAWSVVLPLLVRSSSLPSSKHLCLANQETKHNRQGHDAGKH